MTQNNRPLGPSPGCFPGAGFAPPGRGREQSFWVHDSKASDPHKTETVSTHHQGLQAGLWAR